MTRVSEDTPSSAKLKVREIDIINYLETPTDVAIYLALVAVEDGDDPDQLMGLWATSFGPEAEISAT